MRNVTDQEYQEYYEKYRACLHKSSRAWAQKLGEEEALHIAGIALWRAMQSYDASRKANFLSYLINCIKWTFLDVNKKEKALPVAREVVADDAVTFPKEYDDSPDVLKKKLNKNGRRVIDLIQAGKNPTEISQEIGISRQRVHQIFGEIRDVRFKLVKAGKF